MCSHHFQTFPSAPCLEVAIKLESIKAKHPSFTRLLQVAWASPSDVGLSLRNFFSFWNSLKTVLLLANQLVRVFPICLYSSLTLWDRFLASNISTPTTSYIETLSQITFRWALESAVTKSIQEVELRLADPPPHFVQREQELDRYHSLHIKSKHIVMTSNLLLMF